ncbi:MAG: TadE/TadG family type IV pilus assembly protein [Hyphomicrobium sp.]|nr:pilus assembly protein [Hyphomicrobium sp.]
MKFTLRQRIALSYHAFKDNCAGVAAIEFAYLLPLLIMMTYGVIEASRAVMMHKRFQRSVALIGDLVAREEEIGTTPALAQQAMDGMMRAAEHVMSPYDTSSLKMGVTAIQAAPNDATDTTVAWSYSYEEYPVSSTGAPKNMPAAGMITAGNAAILVEAQYKYKPILTNLVPGFDMEVTWNDQISHAPRGRCPKFGGTVC